MGRSRGKHLDNRELDAFVPSPGKTEQEMGELSLADVRDAQRHADSCLKCAGKVRQYRQLAEGCSWATVQEAVSPGTLCPKLSDDDWGEVAAGLWPESKATQLIAHAASCDHCGPLLRSGVRLHCVREETPSRVASSPCCAPRFQSHWAFTRWLAAVMALVVIVAVLRTIPWSSRSAFSGAKFAEFAVNTHREHVRGKLALDLRSASLQELNEWLKAKSPFSVSLPACPIECGEERPYYLQGAQLVRVDGKAVDFIAYQVKTATLQTTSASLMVTPDSVAVASGGIQVNFKKVTFHYSTVEGYKVVTWSVHGLTYALVSEEGNSTQRSCMVCHSAMKDRDLSHAPAPLRLEGNAFRPVWQ